MNRPRETNAESAHSPGAARVEDSANAGVWLLDVGFPLRLKQEESTALLKQEFYAQASKGSPVWRSLHDIATSSPDVQAIYDHFQLADAQVMTPLQASPALAGWNQYKDAAVELIQKLDTEKRGYVTRQQIVDALDDNSIRGREAASLAALYRIANGSVFERPTTMSKVSPADLNAPPEKDLNRAFAVDWLCQKIIPHHSEFFSKSDIRLLANSGTAADKFASDYLLANYDALAKETKAGSDGLNAGALFDTVDAKAMNFLRGNSKTALMQQTDMTHDLYSNSANPIESISPDAIHQGIIGDCYFLAGLASVAGAHPDMILQAIKENRAADGTVVSYTVTFPTATDEPITIKPPTEAEMALFQHSGKGGVWPSVLEKAYAEYCNRHFWRSSTWFPNAPIESINGAHLTSSFMNMFIKHTDSYVADSPWLPKALENAFANGHAKAAAVDTTSSPKQEKGLLHNHVYSILGFDPSGKDGGTVQLRNPHGTGDNTPEGRFAMSLKDFQRLFSTVRLED